jgi:hypothetical protein
MKLLTIASLIIALVLSLLVQKKLKEVFNLHVKCDKPVISRKVNIFSFNLACVSCQIAFFMFDVSTLKFILELLKNLMYYYFFKMNLIYSLCFSLIIRSKVVWLPWILLLYPINGFAQMQAWWYLLVTHK